MLAGEPLKMSCTFTVLTCEATLGDINHAPGILGRVLKTVVNGDEGMKVKLAADQQSIQYRLLLCLMHLLIIAQNDIQSV